MRQFTSNLLVKIFVSVFVTVISAYAAPTTSEIDWIDVVSSWTYRGFQSIFEDLGAMPGG